MAVTKITQDQFKAEVLESTVPTVVKFQADWCGPCHQYSPIVEAVSEDFAGEVKFVAVDIDESPEIAQAYGVRGIPMTGFFQNGSLVDSMVGAHNKRTLEKKVKKTF